MTPDEFFDRLGDALPDAAGLEVTAAERQALLDLARVAAHRSERWAAPISTFIAGVALGAAPARERLRMLQDVLSAVDDTEETGHDQG